MKKLLLSITAVITIASTAIGQKKLTINSEKSTIEWIGDKVVGEAKSGTIKIKSSSLIIKNNQLANGIIVIDMQTISSNLEGDWKTKLEGHLSSPDFFDVAKFKTASLKINSVKLVEGEKYTVLGDLTIKGITNPIEFSAIIKVKNGMLGAYAELSIDRTEYGIKYGSGKFFEGLGDNMIKDEFILKFKIAAE